MKNFLILNTASENVTFNLFKELCSEDAEKYCLIQSSKLDKYQSRYKDIQFIDICKEGFYDISENILNNIKKYHFDIVYIPTTSVRATNFGNILEIINKLNYEKIIFFNCDGEKSTVNKMGKLQEKLIKLYISLLNNLYIKE